MTDERAEANKVSTAERVRSIHKETVAIATGLEPDTWAYVETTRGLKAIVDAELAEELRKHRWWAVIASGGHIYAVADIFGKRISMQRYVAYLSAPGRTLDEIKNVSFANKHTLDCRMENLANRVGRTATMRNRKGKRGSSSKFKGVRKIPRKNGGHSWRVEIKASFGIVRMGSFDTEREAALAYDQAALELFEGAEHRNLPMVEIPPEIKLRVWQKIERARRRAKGDAGEETA